MTATEHSERATLQHGKLASAEEFHGFSVRLATVHCQTIFHDSEKATFIIRHLKSVVRTLGLNLRAWHLCGDQLCFMVAGVHRLDANRIIYNFINFTNSLARRRFGHNLWRSKFSKNCFAGPMEMQLEQEYLEHLAALEETLARNTSGEFGSSPPGQDNQPRRESAAQTLNQT